MQIAPGKEQSWQAWQEKNQDFYGSGVVRYGEAWANLMEAHLPADFNELEKVSNNEAFVRGARTAFGEMAQRTSHEANTEGITGFMYGAAVHMLADVWLYGEELRKWHNKEWGYEGDGTLNPAVVTISLPGE